MTNFRDEETAQSGLKRIAETTHLDVSRLREDLLAAPDPDRALVNLERWLKSVPNPELHLEHLMNAGKLSNFLYQILGGAQPLANALIQSPELAALLTDPSVLNLKPTRDVMEKDGRGMIANIDGYSYALDRLRYLRHRWLLPIVAHDLANTRDQETVWHALSELADAVIALAAEVSWRQMSAQPGIEGQCPVNIIAFGKLGGHEVNYSSDVDLVYVSEYPLDETREKHATRFCELLNKALSEKMGRGSLYRVDLRLRPFGGAGPLVQSKSAIETYYRSHAEVWEAQALVRSRIVTGSDAFHEWWQTLREEHCFRKQWTSSALEQALESRLRTEQSAKAEDVKRGIGGIRDVEFIAQMLQLVYGHSYDELRTPNTTQALKSISKLRLLLESDAQALIEGYCFLRKTEHRCQLVEDFHTHDLPLDEHRRAVLARAMGFELWEPFESQLNEHRCRIRQIFASWTAPMSAPDVKGEVLSKFGTLRQRLADWIEALPESGEFYRSLHEHDGSVEIARDVLIRAPALIPILKSSIALTEELLTGELEVTEHRDLFEQLALDAPIERVAKAIRNERARSALRWVLNPADTLGKALSDLGDASIRYVMKRSGASFDVVALGSCATHDSSLVSDCDLLFLVESTVQHPDSEAAAERALLLFDELKRAGAAITVDLRLRPEGKQGLLVRTYSGFRAYDLGEMEMWERFALGEARSVLGNPMAEAVALASAYALPLTPERLEELLSMKRRIESERVPAKYQTRNLKLGRGGLSDIEWFVHLHELRYPTATQAGTRRDMPDRIRSLAHAQLIHSLEQETLLRARIHLLATRDRLALLGFTSDIVPENPDRLDSLALASGYEEGNRWLAEHEDLTHSVRSIYEEGVERLRT